jgi:hypothetical protein
MATFITRRDLGLNSSALYPPYWREISVRGSNALAAHIGISGACILSSTAKANAISLTVGPAAPRVSPPYRLFGTAAGQDLPVRAECHPPRGVAGPVADEGGGRGQMRGAHAAIHELAHQVAGGRWLLTGGGGYELLQVVPRTWAHLLAEAAGHPIDPTARIPAAWREHASRGTGLQAPESMTEGARHSTPASNPDTTQQIPSTRPS